MGWIILIISLIVLKVILTKYSYQKQFLEHPNLIRTYIPIYAGGLDFLAGGCQCIMYVNKGDIEFNFNQGKETIYPITTIDYNNIKNIRIQTDSQIQKDIKLSGLLILGVLHLATKQNKNVYSNFIVIEYIEDNQDKVIMLTHQYIQTVYNDIVKQKSLINKERPILE